MEKVRSFKNISEYAAVYDEVKKWFDTHSEVNCNYKDTEEKQKKIADASKELNIIIKINDLKCSLYLYIILYYIIVLQFC